MAREIFISGVQATQLIILPTGASALLIQPINGEMSTVVKYVSGGSLEIQQAPYGTTKTITLNQGYIFGTTEFLSFTGAARYYLAATGATTIVYLLKGLSDGW